MNGDWDVENLPELIYRVVRSGVVEQIWKIGAWRTLPTYLYYRFLNPQSISGARKVAEVHYDIGNDLYEKMLGETMVYSCGYWNSPAGEAKTLDEAQAAKLDLACRKLGLKAGDRILDIGCGWGSMLKMPRKTTVYKGWADYLKGAGCICPSSLEGTPRRNTSAGLSRDR